MLISFSGLDSAGKSTQIRLLTERLQAVGIAPQRVWTRGGYTPGFRLVKRFIRRTSGSKVIPSSGDKAARGKAFSRPWVAKLWLTASIFDLLVMYGFYVRWLLLRGKTVICDRYVCDTLVDFQVGLPREPVRDWLLWKLLEACTPKPAHAFYLMIPVDESVRRSELSGDRYRLPVESLERRSAAYQSILTAEQMMDGTRPAADLADEIWAAVSPH